VCVWYVFAHGWIKLFDRMHAMMCMGNILWWEGFGEQSSLMEQRTCGHLHCHALLVPSLTWRLAWYCRVSFFLYVFRCSFEQR
jgi:hypothetical protein